MNTSSQPQIILVDMDGVIADQHLGFLNILQTKYPEIFATYKGVDTEYEFERNFPEEHHAFIKSLREQEGFFRNLPPVVGAKEALEEMVAAGHDVFICTAPIYHYSYCIPEKYEWIEKNLGREWAMKTIIARDKTVTLGTYLIDDNTEVKGIQTPSWEHIVFDQSYNKEAPRKRRLDWSNWKSIIG